MSGRALQNFDEHTPADTRVNESAKRPLRRRSRLSIWRERAAKHIEAIQSLLLTVVVVGSLLAVGTVHVGALLAVGSVAVLNLALVCFTENNWKARVPPPAWVLAALSLYCLLQSVPLPFGWLRHLSPASAQVWTDARRLLGENTNAPACLSLDPGASRAEGLKWLTYAAVFCGATQLTRRAGAKRGLFIVVLSALLGGILTIVHGLVGIDKWLGLYEPQYAHPPWALSPLLNPNNFAGYLNLATFAAIGLTMTGRPPAPRWALGVCAAMLFALSFLTASRGGALALLVGVALVALALREQARRFGREGIPSLPGWLALLGATGAGVTLFLLGSNDTIWAQLLDETTSKIHMVEWTAPMIRDYRWFGVGRGAYETVSAAYRTTAGLVTFQHAENFVADWLAEWGVVVTAAALLCFFWFLRPTKLGVLRHPLPTAALIGAVVLLLQNLVDLGLEVTAVGIALAMVLGSIWGGDIRDRDRRAAHSGRNSSHGDAPSAGKTKIRTRHRSARGGRTPALVAASVLSLGASLVAWVGFTSRPDVLEQRKALHETVNATMWTNPARTGAVRSAIAAAIRRHPADGYLTLLGAVVAKKTGQNELPWLNQALRRDPLSARAELMLADSLAARGARQQALGVLRRCAMHEPNLVNTIAERATRYSRKLEDLLLAVPEGRPGQAFLNALAMYENRPETRQLHDTLLALALERESQSPATRGLLVDDLIRDLDTPNGPCSGAAKARCEAQLQEHAKVIEQQGPRNLQAVLLRSRLLLREGKVDEAVSWLAQHCENFTSDSLCAAQWVSVAARAKSPEPLEEAANTHLAIACSTPEACAAAATWIGNLFMARGNYELALTRFERAANESPSADAWLHVADAALRSGHVNRAQSAMLAARRFGAANAELEGRVEQARRDQLLRSTTKP